jgi:undecaprenyl-diphosphatase
VLAAAAVVRRDRARALACLVGPPLALLLCELVVKPLVGRTLGGALSFPSGSTVGAAALATAAVLVTPVRWRKVAVVMAAAYGLWMAVAVVSLGWHYPTDALVGLAFGGGVVLLADGVTPLVVPAGGRPPVGPSPVLAAASDAPGVDSQPSA